MKKRITFIVAIVGCLIAAAAVAAGAASDNPSSDANSTDPGSLLKEQQAALAGGGVEVSAGDDTSATGVIGDDGNFIQCNGKDLMVQERGAEAPEAFLAGAREDAVPMPGEPKLDNAGVSSSFAARCGPDGQPVWRKFG